MVKVISPGRKAATLLAPDIFKGLPTASDP